jgi:23S rRNA (pseudouridine1915-N3)-methyltransferase
MLTVNIICIGKLKEAYLRDAQAEYLKRLGAFCKLNIIELNESKLPNDPSDALIQKGMEIEAQAILSKLKGYIIPLCIEGKILSSEELASKMSDVSLNGTSDISFVIGGSFGLSDEVKQKADFKLSMSKMTFPHQLARVMLLEQVYRGFQINANGKYHK